jgi:D-alanyl-lipoteichoic acid acyltransferase DltB (MBOAT superfamily)
MLPQFQRARTFRPDAQALAVGLSVFIIGLAKKLLLADSLGGYADVVFLPQHLPGLDTPAVWRGVLAYTLQIYFDFSAYCDMAIGASRMFNITLPANFESPYKSCSIIDFWRRWHITLSRFLRDYLYIPLGGNRLGAGRRYANLIITMLLGGLWHGAGWNFIIWGALHGFYLSVNHLWAQRVRRRLPAWSGWVLTFSAVMLAWVFFRAPDVSTACALLRKMAGLDQPPLLHPTNWHALAGDPQQALVLAVGLLIALALPNLRQIMGGHDLVLGAPGLPAARPWRRFLWQPSFGWAVTLAGSFALSLLYLSRVTQFLYFQF